MCYNTANRALIKHKKEKLTMKRKIAIALVAVLALCVICFAGCVDPNLKEVAGTYEITDISGGSALGVTKNAYEYFRLILDARGRGTVEYKIVATGVAVKSKGRYTYEDGKINMTTTSGSQKVTETYDYADGVITYAMNLSGYTITLTFTRVEK